MAPRSPDCRSITLDQEAGAPQAARRALAGWFPDLPARVRDDALVAVTELVTNAVRFGRPPIEVVATLGADLLVVEVTDEGPERPRRRVPAEDVGVGLNLVYLLTDRVEFERERSRVRCEFGMSGRAASAAG